MEAEWDLAIGVDIGGSSIKGVALDVATGDPVSRRLKVPPVIVHEVCR
jgi:predicted NBD/HSP70 family sugar kinase